MIVFLNKTNVLIEPQNNFDQFPDE
jgi:hypothetical protein